MEVVMQVEPHLPLSELKLLEREESNAGRSKRLRIIILALEGWTAPAIAVSVGLSQRICQRWGWRYNTDDQAGLDGQRGGNRQSSILPAEDEQRFTEGGGVQESAQLRGTDVAAINRHWPFPG